MHAKFVRIHFVFLSQQQLKGILKLSFVKKHLSFCVEFVTLGFELNFFIAKRAEIRKHILLLKLVYNLINKILNLFGE